jgi:hypothetical protein
MCTEMKTDGSDESIYLRGVDVIKQVVDGDYTGTGFVHVVLRGDIDVSG